MEQPPKKLWQGTRQARPIKETKLPEEYISIDSFEPTTKGFIAQIKGNWQEISTYRQLYLLTITQTFLLYTCKRISWAMNSWRQRRLLRCKPSAWSHHFHVWPYAIRLANEVHNHSPCGYNELILITTSDRTSGIPNISNLHAFSCPAYVLQPELQARNQINKWRPWCRLGTYLGPSLAHTSTIHLILSLTTSRVSPQFHFQFDNLF